MTLTLGLIFGKLWFTQNDNTYIIVPNNTFHDRTELLIHTVYTFVLARSKLRKSPCLAAVSSRPTVLETFGRTLWTLARGHYPRQLHSCLTYHNAGCLEVTAQWKDLNDYRLSNPSFAGWRWIVFPIVAFYRPENDYRLLLAII